MAVRISQDRMRLKSVYSQDSKKGPTIVSIERPRLRGFARIGKLRHSLHRHGYRSADRVADRRMILCEIEQIIQIFITAVRFDFHVYLNLFIANWN